MPHLIQNGDIIPADRFEQGCGQCTLRALRSVTRPEASFINASPWSMCISGVGKRFWEMADTATASVGDNTAARAKATGRYSRSGVETRV